MAQLTRVLHLHCTVSCATLLASYHLSWGDPEATGGVSTVLGFALQEASQLGQCLQADSLGVHGWRAAAHCAATDHLCSV